MELTNYVPTALSSVKSTFQAARRDPTSLVKAALETVEEVTDGKAVLLDATNPFVMLMEMGAVLSSNCIQESQVLLRRQYAALAQTEADLYAHMSDEDYLNRFAKPPRCTFTFALQVQDLVSNVVYDSTEDTSKAILPRESSITVDGITFTILYPIVIRKRDNGNVQISYDASITNPVYSLTSTIIDYDVRTGTALEDWVFFDIEALQVAIATQYYTLDQTYTFKKTVDIADSFYYARAFYRNDDTGNTWIELKTTHTDQVFDVSDPTVLLTVTETQVEIRVPTVYLTTGALSGELRVDIYTTKGEMVLNLSTYRKDNFVVSLTAIDEERDLNAYTNAMGEISYYVYSTETISGGSDALTFDELRERVIYNAVGPQNLPITNVQLEAEGDNDGFDIVSNIDVLTNRVFLATRKLPTPTNKKLITPANIGMTTYTSTLAAMLDSAYMIDNGDRMTLRSKALWQSVNGQLKLLTSSEINALYTMVQSAMITAINDATYFYTPFYYVLDASADEFEMRAYALDQPYAKSLNFIRQNQTLQLAVNVGSYALTKVDTGYELRIVTNSGTYYKNLEDQKVGVQLAFYPNGETTYAYINGVLESVDSTGERIYRFDLNTNHDLDSDDLLCITNSSVQGVTDYVAWIGLETTFNLLHYTTSLTLAYSPDETDAILGKFLLVDPTSVGNSHEKLTLHLGDALSSLWRRSRSYLNDRVYRLHTEDVPKLYENDVFARDPITGSIFSVVDDQLEYVIEHHAGDPVLDTNGDPVYTYRVGDVMLDENGDPVYDINSTIGRELDLLVVDGRYYFADDAASVSYRSEIETTLTAWITTRMDALQDRLLEQSKIFFYPKTTLGTVQVYTQDSEDTYLSAEQSFQITLHVKRSIYDDLELRKKLKSSTVAFLDEAISASTVNMTIITENLKTLYGDSVVAFQLSGLGGEANYALIRLASERNKLCLKKQLVAQADRTMIVEDAVTIDYRLAS